MTDDTTGDLRKRLAELGGLGEAQQADRDELRRRAAARVDEIGKRLDELRPKVLQDDGASDEYLALSLERGTLMQSILLAREPITFDGWTSG